MQRTSVNLIKSISNPASALGFLLPCTICISKNKFSLLQALICLDSVLEYARLNKVIDLNPNAAIQLVFGGSFQIMGFNFKLAGYSTAEEFVEGMFKSERSQLNAFLTFVEKSGLVEHIRDKNWAAFARGYNGARYQRKQYDLN